MKGSTNKSRVLEFNKWENRTDDVKIKQLNIFLGSNHKYKYIFPSFNVQNWMQTNNRYAILKNIGITRLFIGRHDESYGLTNLIRQNRRIKSISQTLYI